FNGDGSQVRYGGDDRSCQRLDYGVREHPAVTLLPDIGGYVVNSNFNWPGQTRRYDAQTALAPDGVTLYEDSVLQDCYQLDNRSFASTSDMHIDISGDAGARYSQAHFYGGAGNPLTPPSLTPDISWDFYVRVSKSN